MNLATFWNYRAYRNVKAYDFRLSVYAYMGIRRKSSIVRIQQVWQLLFVWMQLE